MSIIGGNCILFKCVNDYHVLLQKQALLLMMQFISQTVFHFYTSQGTVGAFLGIDITCTLMVT
jgi:hypothetical protein